MQNSHDFDELSLLLAADLDGKSTADEHARLEQLLDTSASARQFFIDYVDLHANLLWTHCQLGSNVAGIPGSEAGDDLVGTTNPAAAEPNDDPHGNRGVVLGFLGAVTNLSTPWLTSPKVLAIGILGALTTYFIGLMISIAISRAYLGPHGTHVTVESPAAAPARIVADEGVRWRDSKPADQEGQLPPGVGHLTAGVIQLEFDGGARVRIEAPAEFVARSGGRIELRRGRLAAYVPRQARGFTVETPTAEVIDQGTEFDVVVDSQGSTDVHVIRGAVDLKSRIGLQTEQVVPQPSASIRLHAGQSRRISREGQVSTGEKRADAKPAVESKSKVPGRMRDLVDLLAGGDGTGHERGVAIDVTNGNTGHMEHFFDTHRSDHEYHTAENCAVLDGCFIPDGQMSVDSAGHFFVFQKTSGATFDHIWADASVPWVKGQSTQPLAAKFGESPENDHVALWMHCNKGMTFDLDAMRELWPGKRIVSFQAFVVNCLELAEPTYRADLFVLVDGRMRYERRQFSQDDPVARVSVLLNRSDRYLTLAATEGEDGNGGDWITVIDPQIELNED